MKHELMILLLYLNSNSINQAYLSKAKQSPSYNSDQITFLPNIWLEHHQASSWIVRFPTHLLLEVGWGYNNPIGKASEAGNPTSSQRASTKLPKNTKLPKKCVTLFGSVQCASSAQLYFCIITMRYHRYSLNFFSALSHFQRLWFPRKCLCGQDPI